jgi:hypothetical protein
MEEQPRRGVQLMTDGRSPMGGGGQNVSISMSCRLPRKALNKKGAILRRAAAHTPASAPRQA